MSRYNRVKGHTFERETARQFQEMGWDDARTTRAARGGDWSLTDDGTDLVGTEPFAVQCKRLAKYVPVGTIEEIQPLSRTAAFDILPNGKLSKTGVAILDQVPLLLTKANGKPTMAVLPWSDLQKILRLAYPPPETLVVGGEDGKRLAKIAHEMLD